MRDALQDVVDGGRPLIRPVAEPIANQQVTALQGGLLLLKSAQQIRERLNARRDPHTPVHIVSERDGAIAAGAAPALKSRPAYICRLQLRPRARAAVHEPARYQTREHVAVCLIPLALSRHDLVGHEAEPREVFEDRGFVLRSAALSVVVFDAQQHASAVGPREVPHVLRVAHVSQMQIAGWRRREARDDVAHFSALRTFVILTGFSVRSGFHRSPTFPKRSGAVRMVKSRGSSRRLTSAHLSGVDTPA